MPSSGYGVTDLLSSTDESEWNKVVDLTESCARDALRHGLFTEWLGSFVSAWNATNNLTVSAIAGITEWDL